MLPSTVQYNSNLPIKVQNVTTVHLEAVIAYSPPLKQIFTHNTDCYSEFGINERLRHFASVAYSYLSVLDKGGKHNYWTLILTDLNYTKNQCWKAIQWRHQHFFNKLLLQSLGCTVMGHRRDKWFHENRSSNFYPSTIQKLVITWIAFKQRSTREIWTKHSWRDRVLSRRPHYRRDRVVYCFLTKNIWPHSQHHTLHLHIKYYW